MLFLFYLGAQGSVGLIPSFDFYSRFLPVDANELVSRAGSYPTCQVEGSNFNKRLNGCISGLF